MVDHPVLAPRTRPDKQSAWMDRVGVAHWIGYAIHEPRDFAYCFPRRIACRVFGRHNATCHGRRDHPRTW